MELICPACGANLRHAFETPVKLMHGKLVVKCGNCWNLMELKVSAGTVVELLKVEKETIKPATASDSPGTH